MKEWKSFTNPFNASINIHKKEVIHMDHGIELYYCVTSKATGEEVKRCHGKFANMDDFYDYMQFRYGYTSNNYTFLLSGKTF